MDRCSFPVVCWQSRKRSRRVDRSRVFCTIIYCVQTIYSSAKRRRCCLAVGGQSSGKLNRRPVESKSGVIAVALPWKPAFSLARPLSPHLAGIRFVPPRVPSVPRAFFRSRVARVGTSFNNHHVLSLNIGTPESLITLPYLSAPYNPRRYDVPGRSRWRNSSSCSNIDSARF